MNVNCFIKINSRRQIMTKIDRKKAIESEHKESQQRGRGLYSYVKVNELDRLGIEQFKPSAGDNFISIVCNPQEEGFYGRKVAIHQHIGVDDRTYICPKGTWDKPCPICEEIVRMRKNSEDQELINELRPSIRYLFFVLDVTNRKTEEKGLQWFDASPGIKDEIVALSINKRSGEAIDVSDPDDGRAIAFTRTGTRLKTRYKGFELEDRDPIPDEILDEIPFFDDVLQDVTYEDLEKAFLGESGEDRKTRSSKSEDRDEGRSRRRSREQEEEDGSRSRRSSQEDDEEEDKGRSRRQSRDENQEEKSSRRRSRSSEEEPEKEEKSSRRRSRNEDDEEKSSRRSRSSNEADEKEEKSSRRRSREDDTSADDQDEEEGKEDSQEDEPSSRKESLSERIKQRRREKEAAE
jgi:hypothetical protein